MTEDRSREVARLLELERTLRKHTRINDYYPDTGPLRRELYVKHLEFFAAGATRRERLFLAANRVGKSEGVGGYEMTCHLTGQYPDWWEGRRFNKPILAWAAGDTAKCTRDIIQRILLGPVGEYGTGLIPRETLVRTTQKPGVSDCVESIFVRHSSGGISEVTLKSFDQGREAFQGTNRDVIWLDEEADRAIYVESLLRTMTTNGILILTFTPLLGMTDICRDFLAAKEQDEGKFVSQATWDDAPHLTREAKEELWKSIPEFQRKARSKGIPVLGSGAIYPVDESDFVIPPHDIPKYHPRAFGMDVGWNKTACVWGSRDNESGVITLYSEHYMGQQVPLLHAEAIRSRGAWIPGVVDPAARGRSQVDGTQLIHAYRECGLELQPAANAVEAGIYAVWQLLAAGKLKVFSSLNNWLQEVRLYQRDQDGKIVKQNDHLMDATRYLIMSGRDLMRCKPAEGEPPPAPMWISGEVGQGWMN
jgi:phage terminase large subunit-like protein